MSHPTLEFDAALDELLTHLVEESAEVIQACTKMRRFGIGGTDPRVEGGPANHMALAMELGQVLCVWECINGLRMTLLRDEDVQAGREHKFVRFQKYLKHSTVELVDGYIRTRVKESS